ncbi:MFS transporter [Solirubrobacter sp. CPCC 204708]|uniref:MFS transporter n=1 Tax=Solirubrobacter deserti TaxID=2282478 RepID=A0ABT4RTJ8_9ACTN|nr:MFS transporter [Solirubrobacter deserti]MBE2315912.1 MFS transporter [Solirubrobacter deserti]MDA0141591.1 MFS transporter [Solirubrobacter deserti]
MEQESRQAPGRTLAILGVGTLGFVLAQTTVIPALGEMQRELDASASGIAWMVTAYLLVASIATPICGKLGDMFGKERFLALSLAAFAVGSVVCAFADSLGLMIVGRGLQGLGGGVFPLSFGIIRDEFPANKVPTGIALLGAIAAIGSSIGLPLGGVLVDGPGYHWIFWVSAIMGVGATITTHKFVPESPVRTPGRVDFAGALILGAGLAMLLIAISRGADWGWDSAQTLGLIAGGVLVLVLFGVFEARHSAPLVNMRTLARRPVLTTNVSTLLIGSGMIGTFVLVPQLAQLPDAGGDTAGFGLSATEAGLLLAPGGIASLLLAPLVGRAGERVGSKPPFFLGCLATAGALLGMALAHGSPAIVIVWCIILSAGVGAAFASIPNLIVGAVEARETGEATGVNTIVRNIGSAVGAQLAGSIIASHAVATGVEDAGFTTAFLLCAGGAVIAAASVLLIPGRRGEGVFTPASSPR